MTPDVVVDIGNSRMKWGRCRDGRVAEMESLPPDDPAAWGEQARAWDIGPGASWAIGGVNPAVVEAFTRWVEAGGGTVVVFRKPSALPIALAVDEPDALGIDRVFGAIAARSLVPPGTPAITVDVGTAVTVNLVDAAGVFQGGAILPGPTLMARSLHDYTAKLPRVELHALPEEDSPGKNTTSAIRRGIRFAVCGAFVQLSSEFADACTVPPHLFVTGGGMDLLAGYRLPWVARMGLVPTLNLEGIRIAAGALP